MIYLIRHGKTEANEKHLYCGSTDLPLSSAGREELQRLHYDIENAHFITSGMKRTEETLQILFGNVPHSQIPDFREVDFGIFEMRSFEDLKDDPAYQVWLSGDNEVNIPPHGESGKQMTKRVVEAFSQVEDNTVIITHGGVIAALMAHLFPQEGKNRYDWQPKPGHGYFTVALLILMMLVACDSDAKNETEASVTQELNVIRDQYCGMAVAYLGWFDGGYENLEEFFLENGALETFLFLIMHWDFCLVRPNSIKFVLQSISHPV